MIEVLLYSWLKGGISSRLLSIELLSVILIWACVRLHFYLPLLVVTTDRNVFRIGDAQLLVRAVLLLRMI